MKIKHAIGEALLLASLAGTAGAALAQPAAPAAPQAASPATAPAPAAEDTSRWRYLLSTGGSGILVSDGVEGNEIRSLSTYVVLGRPQGSVDGILTRFEVNCETDMIKDLGSTAYAGGQARGTMASQTSGQFTRFEAGTLFETIATFACTRRTPSTERRVVTGLAAAVDYARGQMRR